MVTTINSTTHYKQSEKQKSYCEVQPLVVPIPVYALRGLWSQLVDKVAGNLRLQGLQMFHVNVSM